MYKLRLLIEIRRSTRFVSQATMSFQIGLFYFSLFAANYFEVAFTKRTSCTSTILNSAMQQSHRISRMREQYMGCKRIDGNLVIAHFRTENVANFSFLQEVQEITGYLMVVDNDALEFVPLPELRIIRGHQLICGKSLLVAANPAMLALRLDSLTGQNH